MRLSTQRDAVVIGGGLAGLTVAYELSKRGRSVTVLSRNIEEAAAQAAAGMLAPQAERLPRGAYLDLCLQSRAMYPQWVSELEELAASEGGPKLDCGFSACGGIIAPVFAGDEGSNWNPPPEGGKSQWLSADQIQQMEPMLSPSVEGGWWYPEDAQVDARKLYKVLHKACEAAGVELWSGEAYAADSLVFSQSGQLVEGVRLQNGRTVCTQDVVCCSGAWMHHLLPIPMTPQKGQMLALRPPPNQVHQPAPLRRVVYSEKAYIVPKSDGRIVVGATVEPQDFSRHVTASGIHQLLDGALSVCPQLADYELDETWAGLRPLTPDTHPVLGTTSWPNLHVAGGYWRNGVLLAPKCAQLVADAVQADSLSSEDLRLLKAFRWDRFFFDDAQAETGMGQRGKQVPSAASSTTARQTTGNILQTTRQELDSFEEVNLNGEDIPLDWMEMVKLEQPLTDDNKTSSSRSPTSTPQNIDNIFQTVRQELDSLEEVHLDGEDIPLDWMEMVNPEQPLANNDQALRPASPTPIQQSTDSVLETVRQELDSLEEVYLDGEDLPLDWMEMVNPEQLITHEVQKRTSATVASAKSTDSELSVEEARARARIELDSLDDLEVGEVNPSWMEMVQKQIPLENASERISNIPVQEPVAFPQATKPKATSEEEEQYFGFVRTDDAYEDIMQFRGQAEEISLETRLANRSPYQGAYEDLAGEEFSGVSVPLSSDEVLSSNRQDLDSFQEENVANGKDIVSDWMNLVKPEVSKQRELSHESQDSNQMLSATQKEPDFLEERDIGNGEDMDSDWMNLVEPETSSQKQVETQEDQYFGFVRTDDAYEDIMQFRGQADEVSRETRMANRAPYGGAYTDAKEVTPRNGFAAMESGKFHVLDLSPSTSQIEENQEANDENDYDETLHFEDGWWNEIQVFEIDENGNDIKIPYKGPTTAQEISNIKFFQPQDQRPSSFQTSSQALQESTEDNNALGFEEGWWNEIEVFEVEDSGKEVQLPYKGPVNNQAQSQVVPTMYQKEANPYSSTPQEAKAEVVQENQQNLFSSWYGKLTNRNQKEQKQPETLQSQIEERSGVKGLYETILKNKKKHEPNNFPGNPSTLPRHSSEDSAEGLSTEDREILEDMKVFRIESDGSETELFRREADRSQPQLMGRSPDDTTTSSYGENQFGSTKLQAHHSPRDSLLFFQSKSRQTQNSSNLKQNSFLRTKSKKVVRSIFRSLAGVPMLVLFILFKFVHETSPSVLC